MKRILVLTVLFLGFFSFAFASGVTLTNFDGTGEGRVETGGLLRTRSIDKSTAVSSGQASAQVYTGACNIQAINMYAPTAGDNVAVFDSASVGACGFVPKFEMAISVNGTSDYIDAKGAPFTKGIYVVITDTDVLYSIVYDY